MNIFHKKKFFFRISNFIIFTKIFFTFLNFFLTGKIKSKKNFFFEFQFFSTKKTEKNHF